LIDHSLFTLVDQRRLSRQIGVNAVEDELFLDGNVYQDGLMCADHIEAAKIGD
jgi:hypothetical protein